MFHLSNKLFKLIKSIHNMFNYCLVCIFNGLAHIISYVVLLVSGGHIEIYRKILCFLVANRTRQNSKTNWKIYIIFSGLLPPSSHKVSHPSQIHSPFVLSVILWPQIFKKCKDKRFTSLEQRLSIWKGVHFMKTEAWNRFRLFPLHWYSTSPLLRVQCTHWPSHFSLFNILLILWSDVWIYLNKLVSF